MGVYSLMIPILTYADNDPDKIISVLNNDLKTLQNCLKVNKLSLMQLKQNACLLLLDKN